MGDAWDSTRVPGAGLLGVLWPGVRLAALLVAAAVALAAAGTAVALALSQATSIRPVYQQDDVLVFLLMGSDEGPPHRPAGDPLGGRSDGLHVMAVDTQERRATIVNIPRDTLAGGTKINAHLALGGPERQVAVVEDYTGIPIDYWVVTSFHGFERLVEGLNGVEIEIERPMVDPFSKSEFRETGPVRADPDEALAFVRNRQSHPDGDFGRTRSQGYFMRWTHEQLRAEQSDLASVARQIARFARFTESNVPFDQLLPLALLALEIDPADVHQDALTGGFGTTGGGASVVHLQPGDAFERIRRGEVGPPDQD